MRRLDLTGKVFGRLTVLEFAGTIRISYTCTRTTWLCRCSCGNKTIAPTASLRTRTTQSCGCLHWERLVADATKHGHKMGGRSPTYESWRGMRERCLRPAHIGYKDYGGRGIKICEAWSSFKQFLKDMGPRPDGKTLDRRDVNGNYEPSNCRWATQKEQQANKRRRIKAFYVEKNN